MPFLNTRFGIHGPTDFGWVPDDFPGYIEPLIERGISHYTLWANGFALVDLAKALIDAGIRVIYRPGEMRIPDLFNADHAKAYRDVGVDLVQIYNEPNLSLEWREWHPKTAPENFAVYYARHHQTAKNMGFTTIVTPLSPGGEIFHRDFFNRMNEAWRTIGILPDIWRQSICGIHNRPTTNPPDATGPMSYDEYKWFRQRLFELTGRTIPMIAPEWGYQPDETKYPNGQYDWGKWRDYNMAILQRFRRSDPNYVGDDFLAGCFWLLRDNGSGEEHRGLNPNWYYANDHEGQFETNLWVNLKDVPWSEYTEGTVPPPNPTPNPNPEPYTLEKGMVRKGIAVTDCRAWTFARSDQNYLVGHERTFDKIKLAVIHHTGKVSTIDQDPWAIANYHITITKSPTCRYHWIIDRLGKAFWMARLVYPVDGTTDEAVNATAIQFALIGNFDLEHPTTAQMQTLYGLLGAHEELFGGGWGKHRGFWKVPHRLVSATACPGRYFESDLFEIKGYL